MNDPEQRWEPISWVRGPGDPVPTCPACGALCRRLVRIGGINSTLLPTRTIEWRCDLHGSVEPEWIDPREDDDESA